MPLRLHVAAHDAEAHQRPPVLGEEGGDDGVERPLAGATQFGLPASSVKAVAAVLHRHAPPRHDDAGAEAHVVALDEAHHHAALVGGGEIDRAALDRVAGAEALRALRIDQPRAAGEVGVVEHLVACCSACRRAGRRRARRRRRRRASSPRSAGAASRHRRPAATRCRSGAGCPAPSGQRCPGRWAGSRAGDGRRCRCRSARPTRAGRRQSPSPSWCRRGRGVRPAASAISPP